MIDRNLIKRVADGVGDNTKLRVEIMNAIGWNERPGNLPLWLTSLDAAYTLIPPGWHVGCLTECGEDNETRATLTENEERDGNLFDVSAVSHQLPRALAAAALKARVKRA